MVPELGFHAASTRKPLKNDEHSGRPLNLLCGAWNGEGRVDARRRGQGWTRQTLSVDTVN